MSTHDELCDCDTCEPPVKTVVGDRFKNFVGVWTVIGFDRSSQGAVLRGPEGQIRTEPVDEHGAIRNKHLGRI